MGIWKNSYKLLFIFMLSIIVAACSSQMETNQGGKSGQKINQSNQNENQNTPPNESKKSEAVTQSNNLKEISIAKSVPSLHSFPVEVAMEKGFFEKQGLKVKMVDLKPSIAVQSMMGGGLDYAYVFGTVVNFSFTGKATIKGIFSVIKSPMHVLMSRPEIKSPKDLEGKVIAVPDVTSGGSLEVRLYLKKENVNLDKVKFVPIPSAIASLAAADQKEVSAYFATVPEYFVGEKKGMHKLAYLGDYVDAPLAGLGATDRIIKNNPEEVQKVVNAIFEGLDYIENNPEKVPSLMAKIMKISEEEAKRALDEVKGQYNLTGKSSCEEIKLLLELFNNESVPDEACSKVVDWSFVEKVKR